MKFILTIFLLCFWVAPASAQDTSLTREFARMGAKERKRIAQEEERSAAQDVVFKGLMNEADQLFRAQRYDEALDTYMKARNQRPYNVYPKVKIQDLQSLIARRDAANAVQVAPDPPGKEGPMVPAVPVSRGTATAHDPPARSETLPAAVEPEPVRTVNPARVDVHSSLPRAAPPMPREDGTQERIFREGRALVLERRVVEDGREEVWRRVTHPWGDVVHFKDGVAVTQRTWSERFGDRTP